MRVPPLRKWRRRLVSLSLHYRDLWVKTRKYAFANYFIRATLIKILQSNLYCCALHILSFRIHIFVKSFVEKNYPKITYEVAIQVSSILTARAPRLVCNWRNCYFSITQKNWRSYIYDVFMYFIFISNQRSLNLFLSSMILCMLWCKIYIDYKSSTRYNIFKQKWA
jgi:hypothetical protein